MPQAATIATANAREMKNAAGRILKTLLAEKSRPIVLALEGELGSGKTTFVQGLARSLGVRGKIQSPTFVLAKWHKLSRRHDPFRRLVHIDAYRLESSAEAERLGLREILRDPDALVVVEWAVRIRKLIPRNAVWIKFRHGVKNSRIIAIKTTNETSCSY